jgi:amidase
VQDAALLLDVLGDESGHNRQGRSDRHADSDRHEGPGRYLQAAGSEPPPLRIGLSLKAPPSAVRIPLDPQIARASRRIASVLRGLGHTVGICHPRHRLIGLSLLVRGEAGVHRWAQRVPELRLLDPRTRGAVRNGALLQRTMLPLAIAFEGRQRRRIGSAFERFDVLLTPTTATQPLPIGAAEGLSTWRTQKLISSACPYAWPWNVLGWPALSIPAGLTEEGLPVGVQLLGGPDSEAVLVSLAAQLQAVERWQERLPPHRVQAVCA